MNYDIRLARPEDIAALPGIELAAARLLPPEDLPEALRDSATDPEEFDQARAANRLWVAVDAAGAPVGFAHVVAMENHLHLEELDVHPDHGRRGLGARLVRSVLAAAREAGYPAVTLTTFGHVAWNAPFYERMGFRRLEPGELSEGLRAELDWETASGLDPAKRVAMRCEV